jgi:hypothetical protein
MKPFSLFTSVLVLSVVACGPKPDAKEDSSAESSASGGKGKSSGPKRAGAGPRSVQKIAAGDGAACAVMDNGTVRCWGKNDGVNEVTPNRLTTLQPRLRSPGSQAQSTS